VDLPWPFPEAEILVAQTRLKLTKASIEERCKPDPSGAARIVWDRDVPGFGLRVGKTARAFIYQRDMRGGRTRRVTIGRYPTWTPEEARKEARALAVRMDRGEDPNATRRALAARGVTLAQGRQAHLARLRAKGGSERTVEMLMDEVDRHLGDWLARPLSEITRQETRRRHERITNKSGPYVANRVMRAFRAIYNTCLREHDLPTPNPCIAVNFNKERRRQEPVAWEDLPAWNEKVLALSPVRRDYQLFVLYTGLRATDAATIRWEHVDFDAGTLHRPRPKGGEDRAFTIPLARQCIELLRRRERENEVIFAPRGGDAGWVFPSVVRRGRRVEVVALAETKEQRSVRDDDGKARKVRWLPSPHRLRDTYTTACLEAGVDGYTIDVLTNHRPATGSVVAGYIRQSSDHLRVAQQRVADFLEEKIGNNAS
jgi:integrase